MHLPNIKIHRDGQECPDSYLRVAPPAAFYQKLRRCIGGSHDAGPSSTCRGRIKSTMKTESRATPANTPKMTLSGTWRSRNAPKAQSPKPPQLMLTRFIMP